MKQKRCVELHIPHYNPQAHNTLNYRRMITHRAIASLYTVPLTAVTGLSRLTKLTTSKGQARPIRFENFESANPYRIGRPIRTRNECRKLRGSLIIIVYSNSYTPCLKKTCANLFVVRTLSNFDRL